jgi:PST family polysaccharide transporter
MKDLKERALRGGVAKLGSQGASFILRIGSMMALARLLDPKDFGLVGMVTVVTGVFALFRDAGLSVVTVQRAEISDDQVSALFWINLLVGTLLALVCAALAPVLVHFYKEPRLFWVTIAMAAGFILNAAGVQHSALLQRHMRFVAQATTEIVSWVVSVGVGVGFALAGYGYWALVWMAISLPAVATIGAWIATRWLPGPPRRGIGILAMVRFGGTVTLNTLVVYVAYNVDKLLIGRLWGATALGVYGRAYQLVSIPTENLNSALGGVAIAALSRLQDDRLRFKSYFLKSYSLVLVITVPVTVACALFSDDIIAVMLGPKWRGAAPLFRLMAPTILAFAMINPLGWLLFASGRVKRSLRMAMVIAPVVITGYVVGLPYGADGVAFGYSAMMVLLTVPMTLWAIHGTVIARHDIVRAATPTFVSAAVAAGTSLAPAYLMRGSIPLARLLVEASVLAIVYVVMLLFAMGQKSFYLALARDSKFAVMSR